MAYEFGPDSENRFRIDESGVYRNGNRERIRAMAFDVLLRMASHNSPLSNQAIARGQGPEVNHAQFARDRIKEIRHALQSKDAITNERKIGYSIRWPITKDNRPASQPDVPISGGLSVRRPFRIFIGDDELKWKPIVIDGPLTTASQILETAGMNLPNELLVIRWSAGSLEAVRPKEQIALSDTQPQRFIIFKTDRTFRFFLNDRDSSWGTKQICGGVLKQLASVDSPVDEIWLDGPEGVSRRIGEMEFVDLDEPGVERFYSRVRIY